MNQLYIMLGMGSALLLLFLAALVFRAVSGFQENAVAHAPSAEMLHLPGLAFAHGRLLFNRRDYEFLLGAVSTQRLARELLRDRKRLVRLWLSMLHRDILTLWRFRRLLAQHGASASLAEELSVVSSAVSMISFLFFLRVGVTLLGPFRLVTVLHAAPRPAEFIRQTCYQLATQLSDSRFAEVRSAWLAA